MDKPKSEPCPCCGDPEIHDALLADTVALAQQAWTRAFKGAIGRLLFGVQKKAD